MYFQTDISKIPLAASYTAPGMQGITITASLDTASDKPTVTSKKKKGGADKRSFFFGKNNNNGSQVKSRQPSETDKATT